MAYEQLLDRFATGTQERFIELGFYVLEVKEMTSNTRRQSDKEAQLILLMFHTMILNFIMPGCLGCVKPG